MMEHPYQIQLNPGPRPPAPPCRLVNKGRNKEQCGDQAFPLTRGEHKDNRALDCFSEDGIQLGVLVVVLLSIASCIFQAAYYKVHHIWSGINGPQIKDGAVQCRYYLRGDERRFYIPLPRGRCLQEGCGQDEG